MGNKRRSWWTVLALCALLVTGCGVTNARGEGEAPIGMANPAAVYCEEQGGDYKIRTSADGSQDGVCIFEDGSECNGWAYQRGECAPGGAQDAVSREGEAVSALNMANPASVHCEEQGGTLTMRTDEAGNQIGVCTFEGGSTCEEWAFFRGECKPSTEETLESWQGTLEALPAMAQFDDAFMLTDQTRTRYGIDAPDPAVAAQLDSFRDTGETFTVFGSLVCGVIDVNECQIVVERVEK